MKSNPKLFAALLFAAGGCTLTTSPSSPSYGVPTPQQPTVVTYQPSEPGGTYVSVDAFPPDEPAPAVDIFYDALAPYGTWSEDPEWGRVWMPSDASYRPYERGYWQATELGFTWIAEEPFGWAVTHYGRWFWNGRWAWKPDTIWGPAWVDWRESDDSIGWAPMPPTGRRHLVVRDDQWTFVPAQYVLRVDLRSLYASVDARVVFRSSQPIARYTRTPRGEVFIAGPDPARLRSLHNVTVVPTAIPPRLTGRYQRDAWQDGRLRDERRRAEEAEWNDRRDERLRSQTAERRLAEEQQRLEAERRAHEEQLRGARDDAERRRVAEEQRRIAEQQNRLEAERRARDEQERRYTDEQRRLVEQQRVETQRRAQEQQQRRQVADEKQRKDAEDQQRQQQGLEQQRRQVADEKQRKDAADQQRQQQAADQQRRQVADEKQRKDAADQQRQQQAEEKQRRQVADEKQRKDAEVKQQQQKPARKRAPSSEQPPAQQAPDSPADTPERRGNAKKNR